MGDPYGYNLDPINTGYTAPATNVAFPKSSGVDWRGVNKLYEQPDIGGQDTTQRTIANTTNMLSTATVIAAGTGLMTGGTGFIVAGLIQLAGGILGTLARPKPHRNPEEEAFERMVKFYRNLGKKSDVARSMASLFTGKPKSSFTNIGGTPMELYKKNPTAWNPTGVDLQ